MKKLLTILFTITLIFTLSACDKNKYEGEIKYFTDSEITSYTMTSYFLSDATMKYQNNQLQVTQGSFNSYAYLDDTQAIEVSIDSEGNAVGLKTDQAIEFFLLPNLFQQMDNDLPFSDYTQDEFTNRFYYQDGQGLFEIWLNEDNYIIEFKVTNTGDNTITFHMYDINSTTVSIPTHNVYDAYEYVLEVVYPQLSNYTLNGEYLMFDDGTFTIKLQIDGLEVIYIDDLGNEWDYQLNGLIGFENESGTHYTLTEFGNLYPSFDEGYLDDILGAAVAIQAPEELFPVE